MNLESEVGPVVSTGGMKYVGPFELSKANSTDLCYDLYAASIYAIESLLSGAMTTKENLTCFDSKDLETSNFEFPFVLKPHTRVCIDTETVIEFTEEVGAIIGPRSGLAFMYGIDVLACIIDPGYRNSIRVILINHGEQPFTINRGDRIAQLRLVPAYPYGLIKAKEINLKTDRGTKGFGSSGV